VRLDYSGWTVPEFHRSSLFAGILQQEPATKAAIKLIGNNGIVNHSSSTGLPEDAETQFVLQTS
jgi:hypothetical protein